MIKNLKLTENRAVWSAAKDILVGGVNSPVRAFIDIGSDPIPIESGHGSEIRDYSGNTYIDYVLSYGALILGHARREVINGIKETVDLGLGFGTTNALEVELAERIKEAIPSLEKIRFVNSGTEAVMGAVRLARGVTGRNKVNKFDRSYHGHVDYLLAKAGSGLAAMSLPNSKGVPEHFTSQTLIAPYGDAGYVEALFKEYGPDVAAVIVEPVGGNHGVIYPDTHFLKDLRRVTQEYGALLIFDEVITGFRFHFGSAAEYFNVSPDIICLGKIIGGGLPIGAYGAKSKIMEELAPLGGVYQASTFSGNPVVMRSGIATLDILATSENEYKRLNEKAARLSLSLYDRARFYGVDLSIRHFGGMFSVHLKKKGQFKSFYRGLLSRGIYFAPSEYETNFISFAHSERDIETTIKAAADEFRAYSRR